MTNGADARDGFVYDEPTPPRCSQAVPSKIRSVDVPQKEHLSEVRTVLDAVAEGLGERAALAVRCGISERHVSYALAAARTLALVTEKGVWRLTERGQRLVLTRPGSLAERNRFREAIEQSAILKGLCPRLLGPKEPSRAELAAHLQKKADKLSEATALRRAATLLAWRQQVRVEQLGLFGPVRKKARQRPRRQGQSS